MRLTYAVDFACEPRRQLGDERLAELVATNHPRIRGPLTAPCRDCPANALERQLGCFGTVALPLDAASERWLLDRLPRDLSTTAGYTLHSALTDFGWDGGYAARLRAEDAQRRRRGEAALCFECEVAARNEGELVVDASQAFDILFGEGHVQAAHPLLLCLFFGLIPHDTPPQALGSLRANPSEIAGQLTLPAAEHDLARALHAVAAAASTGRQFLVKA